MRKSYRIFRREKCLLPLIHLKIYIMPSAYWHYDTVIKARQNRVQCCIPIISVAQEAGESQVQAQPRELSNILSQNEK